MKRIAWLMVALALAGCDKPPAEDAFQGFVDADYLRIAAPEAGWLTGQVISVDGGQSLRRGPSLAGAIEPLFGEDGLRGVIADPA